MLFNSLEYLIFLPVVVALFWLSPPRFRSPLLLVASYVFYMSWKPIYGLLIFGLTAVNYAFGLYLSRLREKKVKRLTLALAVLTNLLALAYFKYAYMAYDSFRFVSPNWHGHRLPPCAPWSIILPLGISFFVFEFIHYLSDVYKGGQPVRSFVAFALFASFFPTQIAGPIKRYQDFIGQLFKTSCFNLTNFDQGVELIVSGLLKKVLLADNLAYVSQATFGHAALLDTGDLWLGLYAFAFQIYFDFSGYTDIARGSALLLGFKVPINFDMPYLSGSVSEFWRRWHISLSTWLRDYLFIPLGGSRLGKARTALNLLITMTLGGLWHGAALHFAFWGIYQGVLLLLHKLWQEITGRVPLLQSLISTRLYKGLAVATTFHLICLGWVLFRAPDLTTGGIMLSKLLRLPLGGLQLSLPNVHTEAVFATLPLLIPALFLFQIWCARWRPYQGLLPFSRGWKAAYLTIAICTLIAMAPDSTPRFIYFQF